MLVVLTFFARRISLVHNLRYAPFMFCILYLGYSLLLAPFKELKFSIQLYHIIYDGAIVLLFPIVIWNIFIRYNCIRQYRIALIICIVIASIYGLFLTLTNGLNPWTMLFSLLQGEGMSLWSQYYADESRLFGRISSVFFHPMQYAAFLGFSVLYIIYIRNRIKKSFFILIMLILIINLVTCGVRSVIGAIIVTMLFYLLLRKNWGVAMKLMILTTVVLSVTMAIPGLDSYIASIFSKPEDSSVGGSSIEMRFEQLIGAFDEIKNNPLLGNGYGWSKEYLVENKSHPILLGFESIIFVVLCNNGIIGLFLFALFGLWYYLYINKHVNNRSKPFFICLIIYYYTYECITGEFAFQFFMLFYTFMLFEYYNNHQIFISEIKNEK